MATLKLHRQRWQTKVRIPKALRAHYGGREFLYRHFPTSDRRAAQREADLWEAGLRIEWAAKSADATTAGASLRQVYERLREVAMSGEFAVHIDGESDPVEVGIGFELEKMADAVGSRDLTDTEGARVAALQDALALRRNQPVPRRPELEASFRDLADDYLKLWRTQQGLKETNTEQQKVATFDLFGGFWGNRPIRDVRKKDAAAFVDALRQMDPLWARSPKAKTMTWAQLQKTFGGKARGLSDATINRHTATLKSLWTWAQERDYCEGSNPFGGFHRKLKEGRNVRGYLAWEQEELKRLFNPAPKRSDLAEVMQVAMFTGMRLDEIASLTRGQIRKADGVDFVQVIDAKTPAGHRRVPLHPRLSWLAGRAEGNADERLWPGFNEEGPGKKAGADAGKEFSRFKLSRGFADRRKVFHSFRNNVVGQLEEADVPINDIAQIVGHEKTFTAKKYNKAGVSLRKLARAVALIDYPGLMFPDPRGSQDAEREQ